MTKGFMWLAKRLASMQLMAFFFSSFVTPSDIENAIRNQVTANWDQIQSQHLLPYLSIAEVVVHCISLLFYTCTVVYLCFLTMNMLSMFDCDINLGRLSNSSLHILVKFFLILV